MQLTAHSRAWQPINHIHTAGNSPAMADGAALLLLGDEKLGSTLGIKPRARIVDAATASGDPLQVLSGCVAATGKLMQKQELTAADLDLFELHEAFAATVVKCQQDLDIPDGQTECERRRDRPGTPDGRNRRDNGRHPAR